MRTVVSLLHDNFALLHRMCSCWSFGSVQTKLPTVTAGRETERQTKRTCCGNSALSYHSHRSLLC